ncbi:hypothetical protein vBOeSunk162_45 [Oenococcus phage vB_OeS_unk162]|nr:hypothetical protein vBOeSunk162_45 [Oenococcus phage vB_OeS_unk162]
MRKYGKSGVFRSGNGERLDEFLELNKNSDQKGLIIVRFRGAAFLDSDGRLSSHEDTANITKEQLDRLTTSGREIWVTYDNASSGFQAVDFEIIGENNLTGGNND